MYAIVKNAHLLIILLTFIFFIINFTLMMRGSLSVNNKLLKVGPHILYTLFILTAIYMISVNPLINLYPVVNGWLPSKLAGFAIYVLSITFALKWAKTTLWRIVGLISALFWLGMTMRLGFSERLKFKNTEAFIDTTQSLLMAIS
jgi:uncharacterized membrane protein SirB2